MIAISCVPVCFLAREDVIALETSLCICQDKFLTSPKLSLLAIKSSQESQDCELIQGLYFGSAASKVGRLILSVQGTTNSGASEAS